MPSPLLLLALLLSVCFSLGAWLQPRHAAWVGQRGRMEEDLLSMVLGDSRRLFANHFFVKADVYFHSGYYPTVFDEREHDEELHVTQGAGPASDPEHAHPAHEAESHGQPDYGFLGPPKDWLDAFGRRFFPSQHVHLEEGSEAREILPWLRLSATLDPQRVETYTVAAFWLRSRLGRTEEAVQFLREGWRANPASIEILFELARLYDENRHDPVRARNLYELAWRKWREQEAPKPEPNLHLYRQIVAHLGRLEEREGRWAEARRYLELLEKVSPQPELIRKQIEELKAKVK